MPAPTDAPWLLLRLTRIGSAVHVHWAAEDGAPSACCGWRWFPEGPAAVGPMACSPQRAGFRAEFRDFRLGPPAPPEEG